MAGHGQANGGIPEEKYGESDDGNGAEEHHPVFQERVPLSCRIIVPCKRKEYVKTFLSFKLFHSVKLLN